LRGFKGVAERTFPGPVEEALRGFSGDRLSGASSMLEAAAAAFSALSAHSAASDGPSFISELEDLSLALIDAQPMMAPIYNLCASVLQNSQPSCQSLPKLKKAAFQNSDLYAKAAGAAFERACMAAAKLVLDGGRILTLSSSRAVLRTLELAKKDWKKFSVTVLESRPMLEGRRAASALAAMDIPVELTTDCSVASEVKRADQILIGADAITEEVVVNKMGTLAAATIAQAASVPLLVVADSSKLLPNSLLPESGRPRNPNEVWESAPQGVRVRNHYFERVPLKFIRTIAMEDGPCKKEDIACRLEKTVPGMDRLAILFGKRESR
jgi:translation initiation factor 2B subunit (eIF-2B alpha/beta/delta family)